MQKGFTWKYLARRTQSYRKEPWAFVGPRRVSPWGQVRRELQGRNYLELWVSLESWSVRRPPTLPGAA